MPEGLWKLVVSFLDNRMFAVDIRGHLSGLRRIRAGVSQGSLLGPNLYTIYTSDLPDPVARGTLLATYADDTAFLATVSTSCSRHRCVSRLSWMIWNVGPVDGILRWTLIKRNTSPLLFDLAAFIAFT